ncbi:MAG: hypothetical protein IJK58_03310 [Clostridia bacterium]|nr:hypothetical protein [Clostridia bacterium]
MKKAVVLLSIVLSLLFVLISCSNENEPYKLTRGDDGVYHLVIFDAEGREQFSTDQPKEIKVEKTDGALTVFSWNAGASAATRYTLFLNAQTGETSTPFTYVLCHTDKLAVLGSSDGITVRSIFDEGAEIVIDTFSHELSDSVEPFVSAELSEDGARVTVTYLSGDDYTKIEETFDISAADSDAQSEPSGFSDAGDHWLVESKGGKTNYTVSLYDKNGKVVVSYEDFLFAPPEVTETNDGGLALKRDFGSGEIFKAYQYYSFERDALSRVFYAVNCYRDEIICFYDSGSEKIVVRNAFDARELSLEFSPDGMTVRPAYLTAVKSAEFIDSDQISVTYYCGENGSEEKTVILDIASGLIIEQ